MIRKTKEQKDLPYERCSRLGPEYLTDSELIAVILRTGTRGISSLVLADEVLAMSLKMNNGLLGIHHLILHELMGIKGIGRVKAIQLKCIGELSKRMARTTADEKLAFTMPETIAAYYMEQLRHEEQEILLCLMLTTKNSFIGDKVISRGTVNASVISPRELFIEALRFHAVNIILVHNHPSGDSAPSREDIVVTKRIAEIGELLGIHLLDHIVIGDHQYTSLRERNLF
ncbi:MAG: RadC family protein [Lachnospiraceae bacterium]